MRLKKTIQDAKRCMTQWPEWMRKVAVFETHLMTKPTEE